jgi:hypothetical protein
VARKNVIYSYKFFDNQVVSSDATSEHSEVSQLDQASIALTWATSTLVAAAEIQVRNGEKDSWRALDFGSAISISGASGAHEIILLAMPFTDLRVFLDVTSGSGTVNAVITAKSVGA